MDVASSSTAPARQRRRSEGGVKETIESILIAFILAFIFRAFVVEAFVIPTGSMAPTLLGANMRFTCPECGYKWTANFSSAQNGDDVYTPSRADGRVFSLICPNCGYRVPRTNPADPDNSATTPPVNFGDRILVLKYLYLFSDPQRWDVVVFKSPADAKYQTNYIKRLIGLPNESIMVLDGDIYVGHAGDALTDYQIQTKPRHAQEALWRIVYDNDFQPADAGQARIAYDATARPAREDPIWRQPWIEAQGGHGWDTGSPKRGDRTLDFDGIGEHSTLRYTVTNEQPNHPLTSWLGYNVTIRQFFGGATDTYLFNGFDQSPNVSDMKLALSYQRKAGGGALRLSMSKIDDVFTAVLLPDRVQLLQKHADGTVVTIGDVPWTAPDHPVRVELTNVDYRVALRVDDRDLIVTTPQQYRPDLPMLLKAYQTNTPLPRPEIAITAEDQKATLSHVSLWRDVYYTNRPEPNTSGLYWATPDHPQQLKADEYFTMGDNSSNSYDARYWPNPIQLPAEDLNVDPGRVPGRFMLGKAFFVYWPAGYRILDKGIVPNFGDMRFIR